MERRQQLAAAGALLLLLAQAAAGAAAQEPQAEPRTFAGKARVTAIDLWLEVSDAFGRVPKKLEAEDFAVLEGGERQTVVGFQAPAAAEQGEDAREPWRLVVYFDSLLAGTASVRWAAGYLADQAEKLAALGPVEVVVADPEPRVVLPATRDPAELEETLAGMLVLARGEDGIAQLRRQVVAGLAAAGREGAQSSAEDKAGLLLAALRQEAALIRQQHDHLLTHLTAGVGAGPRALFLVHDGFDLEPADFYLPRLARVSDLAEVKAEIAAASLGRETETLARALAAYGWITHCLVIRDLAPPPERGPMDFDRWRHMTRDGEAGAGAVTVPLYKVKVGKGKKKGAADGEGDEIPFANRMAVLHALAEATAGAVVTRAQDVPRLVAGLGRRVRVTYQVSHLPEGRLHPVEVRPEGRSFQVRAPRWVRSSTPEAVAEARLRQVLAEPHQAAGTLAVTAQVGRPEGRDDPARAALEVRVDLAALGTRADTVLRLTLAFQPDAGEVVMRHQRFAGEDLARWVDWRYRETIAVPPASRWLGVLVEDLVSGEWGATVLETPDGSSGEDG